MSLQEYNIEDEITDMSFAEELLIKYWKLRFKPLCVRGLIHSQLKQYYIEDIKKNTMNRMQNQLMLAKILIVQDEDNEAAKILE